MKPVVVPFVTLDPNATMPQKGSSQASGFDLSASNAATICIAPMARALVPTGIALELPEGYEAQIRPRSGLALKHGITVLNTPGTIDADYRGEIKVVLVNLGSEPFEVTLGMRIAQMVIAPVVPSTLEVVAAVGHSERGEGGFGSTGLAAIIN